MIWYIDTKDLMTKYIERPIDEIMNTNYLIISSSVLCTEKMDNVLNVYSTFLSVNVLKGVGIMTDPHSVQAKEEFKGYLLRNPKIILFLLEIIQTDVSKKENTLFITTPSEKENGNIEIFCEVIDELFSYKITEYPKKPEVNLTECLERLIYYADEADKLIIANMSYPERFNELQKKTKKELKKMVKNIGLYYPGMDKTEMVEVIAGRDRIGYTMEV